MSNIAEQLLRSPKDIYGKCVIHGRPVGPDEICPECRERNRQMHGEYLWAFGIMRTAVST